jgi:hypothetical protein
MDTEAVSALADAMQQRLDEISEEYKQSLKEGLDSLYKQCSHIIDMRLSKLEGNIEFYQRCMDEKYNELVARYKKLAMDTDEQIKMFTRLVNLAHEKMDETQSKIRTVEADCQHLVWNWNKTEEGQRWNRQLKYLMESSPKHPKNADEACRVDHCICGTTIIERDDDDPTGESGWELDVMGKCGYCSSKIPACPPTGCINRCMDGMPCARCCIKAANLPHTPPTPSRKSDTNTNATEEGQLQLDRLFERFEISPRGISPEASGGDSLKQSRSIEQVFELHDEQAPSQEELGKMKNRMFGIDTEF